MCLHTNVKYFFPLTGHYKNMVFYIKLCNQRQPIAKIPLAIEKFKDPSTADAFTLELYNHFASLEEMANVENLWGNLRDTTTE